MKGEICLEQYPLVYYKELLNHIKKLLILLSFTQFDEYVFFILLLFTQYIFVYICVHAYLFACVLWYVRIYVIVNVSVHLYKLGNLVLAIKLIRKANNHLNNFSNKQIDITTTTIHTLNISLYKFKKCQ